MPYVDGFVIVIAKEKLEEYRRVASASSALWREHGALEYKECVLEDANEKGEGTLRTFPDLAGAAEGETVVFSYIVYESREARDAVNAKVMADPRLQEICPGFNDNPVFDPRRMAYGGFQTIVSA